MSEEGLSSFVLIEYFDAPINEEISMESENIYQNPTVSELEILGVWLWRCDGEEDDSGESRSGWIFKIKLEGMEEMSVVKEFGFFDSPLLTDD